MVYLDTSDYSRLADIGHRKEAEGLRPVLEFLLEEKRHGRVQIRFSFIHILEILKNSSEDLTLALRKASLIERLCGEAVFKYPASVFSTEATRFHEGGLDRGLVTSDEGIWYPDVIPDMSGFRDEMAILFEEAFRRIGMPEREVRRYVEHGGLTPKAVSDLSKMLDPLSRQMPMAGGFYEQGAFDDYLKGRRSGEDFASLFAQGVLRRPTVFMEHWLNKFPLALALFDRFTDAEKRIHQTMRHSREFGLDLSKSTPEIAKRVGVQLEQHWGSLDFENLGLEGLDQETKQKIFGGTPQPDLKAVSAFFIGLRVYLLDNLRPSPVMRKPRESDPGDLLHLVYMPYADVFRADTYMASLIRRYLAPEAQVVDELETLPDLVKSLCSEEGLVIPAATGRPAPPAAR
ncbi:MAG TPA: hypothetical protein VF017_18700 [Thermoanaerobaculia bacterium]|nr:hypothetical protein [Thermoanaerobaculia bacterium]